MKLLIMANHYPVASGRYAADALRRLGHDVRTTGPARGTQIWGLELAPQYIWQPDTITDWKPDAVIVMDSDPAILDASLDYDAPVIVWGVDNHVRGYYRPWIKRYFLAHRGVSMMDWHDTCIHLPCAYDPVHFTPSAIPYEQRAYDVALLGVMYLHRWETVTRLQDAGLRVLAGTGLVYDAYRNAHHNARIALCLSARGDVAQRVFEAAAMGCVVISDKCADFDILKPEGIWTIDHNPVDEIRGILDDPQTAMEMAARGQAWAKPHTWDARAQEVVTWLSNHISI